MRRLSLATALLAISWSAAAQDAPPRPRPGWWPEAPSARRLEALLAAYNNGDEAALQEFVKAHYAPAIATSPAAVRATAAYWMSIYREFGPARAHALHTGSANATEIWARGTISEAWFTLLLETAAEAPHLVTSGGVGKGISPEDVGRPKPMAPPDVALYLRAYLERLDKADLFSGTVLVAHGDKVLFKGAAGFANREHAVKNTDKTRFNIASVGKLLTATALLSLVDANKVSLDDTISKFLPDYPKPLAERVTLRHLLTHTSGIELDDDRAYNADVQKARSINGLIKAQVQYLPKVVGFPDLKPLDRYDYTNEGYDLIGAVIEKVEGRPYHEVVAKILSRAGAQNAGPIAVDAVVQDLATGYTSRDGWTGAYFPGPRRTNVLWMDGFGRPSGGHYATVEDLRRFMSALRKGDLVSAARAAEMWSPQIDISRAESGSECYGYGVQIARRGASVRFGHSGGLPGASSRLDVYPELNYTVVVLSNHDWVANNVADRIGELIGAGFSNPPNDERPR